MKTIKTLLSPFILFGLLIISGCEEQKLDGLNSLLLIENEPTGTNCLAGGYKISNGLDLNRDGILNSEEVQTTNYLCHGINGNNGEDGDFDKQISIPFNGETGHNTTSSLGEVATRDEILDFNIQNYIGIDSIVFGIYAAVIDPGAECIVELYDKTHDQIINNTRITSLNNSMTWISSSVNFIDDLPEGTVDLTFHIKSSIQGYRVMGLAPLLILYRK